MLAMPASRLIRIRNIRDICSAPSTILALTSRYIWRQSHNIISVASLRHVSSQVWATRVHDRLWPTKPSSLIWWEFRTFATSGKDPSPGHENENECSKEAQLQANDECLPVKPDISTSSSNEFFSVVEQASTKRVLKTEHVSPPRSVESTEPDDRPDATEDAPPAEDEVPPRSKLDPSIYRKVLSSPPELLEASRKINERSFRRLELNAKRRLSANSAAKLETELIWLAHKNPSVDAVQRILKTLMETHAVKPTAVHYEAMILANCDPEHGSIKAVKSLLQEMNEEDVIIGGSTYAAVLRVLAVHPNHLYQAQILMKMSEQWMPTTQSMSVSKIASFLRTGQLELALFHLTTLYEMQHPLKRLPDTEPVPDYLLVTLLHTLAAAEDLSAVLQLLYSAEDWRVELSTSTYLLLLDRAAEYLNLDVIHYIWDSQVETTYIIPPTGLCHNVLLAASREGDTKLAESVIKVLSKRDEVGDILWEMLVEAYENNGDEESAKAVRERLPKHATQVENEKPSNPDEENLAKLDERPASPERGNPTASDEGEAIDSTS